MAKNVKRSSYQSLGNGVYRVGAVRRSAVTGRYVVSPEPAPASPSPTPSASGDRRS
ncbi:hypothetical protein EDF36_3959 [Rathayibacter sp. PhB152]|jgi:hypothetical protein|nr:hypothetical protein EDF36_3959 [Rathayibacter sp. PhB152]ROS29170.1 hypothetical protein EDF22_0905 [Rathayibacter sp. PhB127]TDX75492.1 hypothetical protein EDF35_3758 [Rathayibacter sp. PhB151]